MVVVCVSRYVLLVHLVMKKHKILLVSESPRRKRLFSNLTDNFDCKPSGIDEDKLLLELKNKGCDVKEIVREIALAKAKVYAKCQDFKAIVSADTIIYFNNQIIGKPKNKDHARQILEDLNGKEHNVLTSTVLIDTETGKEYFHSYEVKVTFKKIKDKDLNHYVNSHKWKGKAGGYNYEEVKDFFIEKKLSKEDEFIVIGLPIHKLRKLFQDAHLEYLL